MPSRLTPQPCSLNLVALQLGLRACVSTLPEVYVLKARAIQVSLISAKANEFKFANLSSVEVGKLAVHQIQASSCSLVAIAGRSWQRREEK